MALSPHCPIVPAPTMRFSNAPLFHSHCPTVPSSVCPLYQHPWSHCPLFCGPVLRAQCPIVHRPAFHCPMVQLCQRPLSHCPLSGRLLSYCCITRLLHRPCSHGPIVHGPVFPVSHSAIAPLCLCSIVPLSYRPNDYLPIAPWPHWPAFPLSNCPPHSPIDPSVLTTSSFSLAMMFCILLFYPAHKTTPTAQTSLSKISKPR